MRTLLLVLCLQGVAALAQIGSVQRSPSTSPLNWTFGLHRSQPSLSSSLQGSKDGKASLVDTDADLGLRREGGPLGALLEYRNQAHGFRLAYDTLQFQGERSLPRDITLDGIAYAAATPVRSKAKLKAWEGLYTYKLTQQPDAWVGLDLGVQLLKTDHATTNLATGAVQTLSPSQTLPQIGLSGWSSGADGLLESRVFYHYFAYRGLSYHRYGLDARAYLYPGFGLRAFYESSRIKIPPGSTQGNLDIRMDGMLYGVGMVVRF